MLGSSVFWNDLVGLVDIAVIGSPASVWVLGSSGDTPLDDVVNGDGHPSSVASTVAQVAVDQLLLRQVKYLASQDPVVLFDGGDG